MARCRSSISRSRSYGALPLVVVTVKDPLPLGYLHAAEATAVRRIVDEGRATLTTYSSHSTRIEIDGCNHGDVVTRCAPNVVAAIEHVADEARRTP